MNNLTIIKEQKVINSNLIYQIDNFIKSQDVSSNSKQAYTRQIKNFITWLEITKRVNSLNLLTRIDILTFKEYLINKQYSSYSISAYLTVVRKFFEWLESEKLYPNIAKNIKGMKQPKGYNKDCLTANQIKEILNTIDTTTLAGKRDYALFNLLVRTGLRSIEITNILVEDIRQQSGKEAVLFIKGKGRDSKDDFVLLTTNTLQPILEYLTAREKTGKQLTDKDYIFVSVSNRDKDKGLITRSIRRIIKNLMKQTGIDNKRLTCHSLRHSAATLSLANGAKIQDVQAMMRHSSINSTLIYLHNLNRKNDQAAERFINF